MLIPLPLHRHAQYSNFEVISYLKLYQLHMQHRVIPATSAGDC